MEGVIGGVVPGAGGYDAIAFLIEDKEEVLSKLDEVMSSWKVEAYTDAESGPTIGKVSRLPVREEMQGVREEDSTIYDKWLV